MVFFLTMSCKFGSCSILRSASKGTGAYGSVYKARCDGLLCAAKLLHPDLVLNTDESQVPPERLHKLPRMRFERECAFLSALRHPNIVQYLGTWVDPVTNLPVLLMELMDSNLTCFLEAADTTLPFHTQVDICHDVALALSFLHSNTIIHRDLSSNNVLMIGDRRAKVADFGMARLFSRGETSLTENPGTESYMPPEVQGENCNYQSSMDCFSFGVLALQILTLVYPKPGERFVPIEGEVHYKKVSEVQRRQSHLELVEAGHPLLALVLECLREDEETRPPASELCLRVEVMRDLERFSRSKRESDLARKNKELMEEVEAGKTLHREELASLRSEHAKLLEKKEEEREREVREIRDAHAKEMKELEDKHQDQVRLLQLEVRSAREAMKFMEHNQQHVVMTLGEKYTLNLKSLEEDREELRQRHKHTIADLKEKDDQLKKLKKHVEELEEGGVQRTRETQCDAGNSDQKRNSIIINWKQRESPAPHPLYKEDSEAVLCNGTLYLLPGSRRSVLAYSPASDTWREMPKCPHKHCTLAYINNTLLALGGRSDSFIYSNQIHYLTDEGGQCRWEEEGAGFRMPTRRCSVMSITAGAWLVVAGGEGEGPTRLRKVEVFNTTTSTWSTAKDLPEALVYSSTALSAERLFFLGGQVGYNGVERNIMFTCSLEDLLRSCSGGSNRTSHKLRSVEPPFLNVWRKAVGPPVTRSACVSFRGRVLSVGGRGEDRRPTSAVYEYVEREGVWRLLPGSYLTTTRSKCFAAVVTVGASREEEEIIVVGGNTTSGKTDTLEVGTFLK